jgi:Reverse transcriptase (RNA-dependent DNA polymerase)
VVNPDPVLSNEIQQEQIQTQDQGVSQHETDTGDAKPEYQDETVAEDVEPDQDKESQSQDQDDTRVHAVTKSGRKVRFIQDLFQNYAFSQASMNKNVLSPSGHTPSLQLAFGINSSTGTARRESPAHNTIIGHAFTQYSLKQAMNKFPKEAQAAKMIEMKQLHDMEVFKPVLRERLTKQEQLGVLWSIIFIKQKRCGHVKARVCADGQPQRYLYEKWEASSPTVKTESVLLTSVIDAREKQTIGIYDIQGAFLHSKLEETVYMKVSGVLAECLVQVSRKT